VLQVAGDTPVSDGPMLFRSTDMEDGGLRVWVNRKDAYLEQIQQMQQDNANEQRELGEPVTADKSWVVVKSEEISYRHVAAAGPPRHGTSGDVSIR
jgi:hypothetical protein